MLRTIRSKLNLNLAEHILFWAICSIAFYSMARLTELVVESERRVETAVKLQHVQIVGTKEKPGASILLPRTKSHDPAIPAMLCVEPTNDETCLMQALLQYLLVRRKLSYGKDSQILFCYENGSPVTREQFMNSIHMCLPGANIDARSFRSGGATFWTLKGMPEIMIQREGRWSSAAFQRYIRYTVPVRRALRERASQI